MIKLPLAGLTLAVAVATVGLALVNPSLAAAQTPEQQWFMEFDGVPQGKIWTRSNGHSQCLTADPNTSAVTTAPCGNSTPGQYWFMEFDGVPQGKIWTRSNGHSQCLTADPNTSAVTTAPCG